VTDGGAGLEVVLLSNLVSVLGIFVLVLQEQYC